MVILYVGKNDTKKKGGGKMKTWLSMGAGVQTTALLILVAQGEVQADAVIFADTGAEHPETYEYIEKYHKPLCEQLGIPFITVRMHKKITEKDTGIVRYADSLEEVIEARHRVPSVNNRWCTDYSKITPMKLAIRKLQEEGKLIKPATMLIGISTDEKHRAIKPDGTLKQPHLTEYTNKYPLLDLNISRDDCHTIIKQYGWPDPIKSGCYFCPFQGPRDWANLFQSHPDLFWHSVELEEKDINFPTYNLYPRGGKKGLRRLASGPGFGYGSMSLYDDYEGEACVEVESSCML